MARHHTTVHPTESPRRAWLTGAVIAATLGGLLATVAVLATPAQAGTGVPVPVSCSEKVVLTMDDTTYDLNGNCGVVVVDADDVVVLLPATQKLVVRGERNTVHGKTIDRAVLRGRDQTVDASSVRVLRLISTHSVIDVEGLVEEARIGRRGNTLTARQVSDLVVRGRGHDVTARRGFDTRLPADRTRLRFRRLDALSVGGDHNRAVVRRYATEVGNTGDDNTIRVHRRR